MHPVSTRKNCIIRDHLLHEILSIPAHKCGRYECLECIATFCVGTEKQDREDCMGNTSGTTNPDIQFLVDPLLYQTRDPSVADTEEKRIVDSAWETRGEKEREAQKRGSGHGEAKGESQADHESVMEPIIKPEGGTIDPDMIEMKCKTEGGGKPVDLIAL